MEDFSFPRTLWQRQERNWTRMTKMIDVFGCCKCGSVIWVSGDFKVDENGNAETEWECEVCGEIITLRTESKV